MNRGCTMQENAKPRVTAVNFGFPRIFAVACWMYVKTI